MLSDSTKGTQLRPPFGTQLRSNQQQILIFTVTCSLSLCRPSRLAWITSVVYIVTQRMVTMTFAMENWPSGETHCLTCHMLATTHWPFQVFIGGVSYLVTKNWNGMSDLFQILHLITLNLS